MPVKEQRIHGYNWVRRKTAIPRRIITQLPRNQPIIAFFTRWSVAKMHINYTCVWVNRVATFWYTPLTCAVVLYRLSVSKGYFVSLLGYVRQQRKIEWLVYVVVSFSICSCVPWPRRDPLTMRSQCMYVGTILGNLSVCLHLNLPALFFVGRLSVN